MESLWENKALLYALSGTGSFILILALGWLPELDEQFGIIEFPPEVWQTNIKQINRGVFSTGAMGALAPAILIHRLLAPVVFGHFSTVGKNCGC